MSNGTAPSPNDKTRRLLVLTVIVLLIWRLPVLTLVAGGGLVGIVARSKLLHRLREAGFDAQYMKGGHSGWKAMGGAVRMQGQ